MYLNVGPIHFVFHTLLSSVCLHRQSLLEALIYFCLIGNRGSPYLIYFLLFLSPSSSLQGGCWAGMNNSSGSLNQTGVLKNRFLLAPCACKDWNSDQAFSFLDYCHTFRQFGVAHPLLRWLEKTKKRPEGYARGLF